MPIKADKSLRAYYNEIDPYAAQWIRDLMAEGWITKGDVDERSIEDVRPNDLAGYDRLHFFAGIAVWDYALNQAGWGRSEIWTGSCPCQPFSAAGKGAGFADERHLWPHFHWLIEQCRPPIVLGEQVASKDGLAWLDLVSADLEGSGYTSGAVDTCAAGFGAPHIRQRLYWVGHAIGARLEGHAGHGDDAAGWSLAAGSTAEAGDAGGMADARRALGQRGPDTEGLDGADPRLGFQGASDDQSRGAVGGMADTDRGLSQQGGSVVRGWPDGSDAQPRPGLGGGGVLGGWADTNNVERGRRAEDAKGQFDRETSRRDEGNCKPAGRSVRGIQGCADTGPTNGFWRDADWLYCRDGRWRPVGPGASPLVDGAPARVGRLRAYGNSINTAQAEGFIRAVMG